MAAKKKKKKPAKKKKAARKKKASRKKKAAPKRARSGNRTNLTVEIDKGGPVDGGPSHLYHCHLKGQTGHSLTACSVVAKTEADARKKARRILATLGR